MILDVYRAKYNKDFYLNTEYKKCLCGSFSSKKLFGYDRYLLKTTFLFHLNRLGLICIEYGVTGGGKLNQWGIFKIGSTVDIKEVNYEYQKIIKIHKKFFYDFYGTYLVKLYLNLIIKKIIGRKLTQVIKIFLSKVRKH